MREIIMEEEIKFTMENYWLSDIAFSRNIKFDWEGKQSIDLSPRIERKVSKVDDDNAVVSLSLSIELSEKVPFGLNIVVNGAFRLEKWEESEEKKLVMLENAPTVLFPYLRQAASEITMMANIPPYVLPIVNVPNLFKNDNKK